MTSTAVVVPTIDHSLDSPFLAVPPSQLIINVDPSAPVLLPPSAFEFETKRIQSPISSRIVNENKKIDLPRRAYSTQPNDRDNLLHVKQRLEIYLKSKAKLK